jgi:iron complex outermembrane receptor protein
MNDQNSKYTEYSLLDIKTSYTFTILKMLKTELSTESIMQVTLVRQYFTNAVGFGNTQPRAYAEIPRNIMEVSLELPFFKQ